MAVGSLGGATLNICRMCRILGGAGGKDEIFYEE